MAVLSAEQVRRYEEEGYLVVSGLIPRPAAEAAEAAMWRVLALDPRDPSGWPREELKHQVYHEPALLACYTEALLGAAAQLGRDEPEIFRAPGGAYAINVFPREGEWRWPNPHIDHALKHAGHRVFPRAFRVACMTYLTDTPLHGAGTIVWPGSHRKLEALARNEPERYELMWTLGQDLQRADLGEPVELTPSRGDAVFYHYLCAHSGSMNTSDRPRFALNMKW